MIVGGGPAGAATALFLCAEVPELTNRILVLDKASFPRDKICAGAIGARADRLLESIGVAIDVPSVNVRGLHVRAGRRELLARHPRNIGRVVRRRAFDAALLNEVRQRGVTVREATRVTGLTRGARAVELHTDHGAVSAAAVVGADGVGSVVRRALGVPAGRFHAQAVEIDTEPAAGDPPLDVLAFDVRDRGVVGYAWDFPTRVNGEKKVCRGVYVLTRGLNVSSPDCSAILSERLARQGLQPTARFKRFAERGLSLYEPLAVERVLLVGEAAGIDPVLGEGIAQAIFYGQLAARYLARCWRVGDHRFGDYRQAMRRSRVGVDLRVRAAAVELVYGRTRPWIERWVTGSSALAQAGMSYFAGERVPRRALGRALIDLAAPF